MWRFMRVNLSKQDGFTLLEALISLAISSLVLLLLTSGIVQTSKIRDILVNDSQKSQDSWEVISGDRQLEWHLFINQLEHYLQGTKNPRITTNGFVVDEWDEGINRFTDVWYVRLDINRTIFIRRKSSGNQRLLTGLATVHFKEDKEGWLSLKVEFQNGEIYEGKVWVESWSENENEGI